MSRPISLASLVGSVVLASAVQLCANAQSLSSALGATKLDGLKDLTDCTNQSKGYRERIIGDRLAAKLAMSPALTAEERAVWQADIDALHAVTPQRPDFVPPNAREPQHYFLGLTDSEQQALNAVGGALFYVEKQMKDGKLAIPMGLDMACPAASCPDQVEAVFARSSVDHIAQNLRGFRKLFQGCAEENAGFGFDDWLAAVDAGDLATRMLTALDGAEAAVATLDVPLETLVVSDPARVQRVYDAVRVLTNLLKTEFVTTLNLERPAGTVGDND